MAQIKKIQNRIQSIRNTSQIMRAMKMISTVKLKKAQERTLHLRAYADGILSTMADVALSQRVTHPLLDIKKEDKKPLLTVLSSDRGLCGSFNSNICKKAESFLKENKNHDLFLIGKKAAQYFRFRKIEPIETISGLDREVSFSLAARVSQFLLNSFLKGGYDSIRLVYQTFHSAMVQKVKVESFLPIDLSKASLQEKKDSAFSLDLIFEVEPRELVEDLIQRHFTVQIYRAMCESLASEHAARMCAMESAVKNANEMLDHLTLTFNKMRQSSITTELIEVTSGAEAMGSA